MLAFALCAAVVMQWTSSADAQWLELTETPPPPRLSGETYATTLAAALLDEINALERAESAQSSHPAVRASINVRRLAHSLLRTDPQHPGASGLIVSGMELHAKRNSIDNSLERLGRSDEASALLRQFNDAVGAHLSRGDDRRERSGDLEAIAAPLIEALALLDVRPSQGLRRSAPEFDVLRDRAGHAQDRETAAIVIEITDYLERGWAFPDLRPRITHWHALIDEALEYLVALSDATWLDDDAHADGLLRVREAMIVFRDPQRRDEGERRLHPLHAEKRLLRAITTAQQDQVHPVDVPALQAAYLQILDRWSAADHPDELAERLAWLTTLVGRLNEFRALGLPAPTPRMDRATMRDEGRRIRAQLAQSYIAAENALLGKIVALARDPRLESDPASATLIGAHRHALDDLYRLERIQRLVDVATLIRPASADDFSLQMRRFAGALAKPIQGADAAAAIDAVERDLARFWPLPFEDELRSGAAVVARIVGPLELELLEELDRLREEWTVELGDGIVRGDAAQRLALLHRLMTIMRDLAPIARAANHGEGVWWMPGAAMSEPPRRLLRRVHRAVNVFLEGDHRRLMRALDELERSSANIRLFGRLLSDPQQARPVAGALLSDPARDEVLSRFIHYAAEAAHAQATGDEDRAAMLREYTARMASIALARK